MSAARREISSPFLALAVVLLCSSPVRASDDPAAPSPKLRLDYELDATAADCEPSDAFRTRVSERLGRDPFDEPAIQGVRMRVWRDGLVFRGRLTFESLPSRTSLGSRQIESGSCGALLDAVALSLGLVLETLALAEPSRPEQVVEVQPRSRPVRPADEPEPKPEPEAVGPGWRLSLQAAPWLSVGAVPGPTASLRAGFAVAHAALRFGLEGSYDLPRTQLVDARSGLAVGLVAARATTCLGPRAWFGCAALTAGAHRASGRELAGALDVTTPYLSTGARAGLALPLSAELALRLELGVELALTRTTLRISDQPAWSSSDVAGGVGVAVDYALFDSPGQ